MDRARAKCQREKRKTINGDDLLWAMMTLGFEDYMDPLKVFFHKFREVIHFIFFIRLLVNLFSFILYICVYIFVELMILLFFIFHLFDLSTDSSVRGN